MRFRFPILVRLFACLVCCVAAVTASCGGGENKFDFSPATRAALDAAVDKALTDHAIPGAVVGIWIPGQGTYVAARGVSDKATKAPMQTDDFFRIGSNTKTFTCTALLILADEGKLKLDDPVSKYLDFVSNGDNITLRQLGNMTSGLYSYTEDDNWVKALFANPAQSFTARQLADVGLKNPPTFAPGAGWHYSNTNTVLLGMVIAKVAGKPVQDVFAEKLFKPLNLKKTSWPTDSALPSPYAHGITTQTLDNKEADATHRNPSWGNAAGQLISNLDDMKIWVRSYTRGTLISPAMQKERLKFVTITPGAKYAGYGLGIGISDGWLGHTGELPGYNTAGYYLPEKDALMIVMVNSDLDNPDGGNNAGVIFRKLAAIVLPNNPP